VKTRYRGYWIEKTDDGCYDAYMPAFNDHGDQCWGNVWSSPSHSTWRSAQRAIDEQIIEVNRKVDEAMSLIR